MSPARLLALLLVLGAACRAETVSIPAPDGTMLTARLEDGLAAAGAILPKRALRAPHVLCVSFPAGMPAGFIEALATQKAFAAPRLGRLRISPHVYNDEEDVDRFVAAFVRLVGRKAA